MTDPLRRATSSAPPELGEGCTRRYDPQAMSAETGCDFVDAEALWQQLQEVQRTAGQSSNDPAE